MDAEAGGPLQQQASLSQPLLPSDAPVWQKIAEQVRAVIARTGRLFTRVRKSISVRLQRVGRKTRSLASRATIQKVSQNLRLPGWMRGQASRRAAAAKLQGLPTCSSPRASSTALHSPRNVRVRSVRGSLASQAGSIPKAGSALIASMFPGDGGKKAVSKATAALTKKMATVHVEACADEGEALV